MEKAQTIRVKLIDGKEYDATIVGRDPKTDLALIKIDARNSLPAASFGNSDNLEIGDWVVAIGNPFGLETTVTAGIVSAKAGLLVQGPYDDFIQTDASINLETVADLSLILMRGCRDQYSHCLGWPGDRVCHSHKYGKRTSPTIKKQRQSDARLAGSSHTEDNT